MNRIALIFFLVSSIAMAGAKTDTNETNRTNLLAAQVKSLTDKQVKKQMAKEAEHARTQSFAQGDDYDLKSVEINEKSLNHIQAIEPDYDFDITDVYRDDI